MLWLLQQLINPFQCKKNYCDDLCLLSSKHYFLVNFFQCIIKMLSFTSLYGHFLCVCHGIINLHWKMRGFFQWTVLEFPQFAIYPLWTYALNLIHSPWQKKQRHKIHVVVLRPSMVLVVANDLLESLPTKVGDPSPLLNRGRLVAC